MKKQDIINQFIQQLTIAGYSPQTVKSYTSAVNKFLEYIAQLHLTQITEKHIQDYLFICAQQRQYSFSSMKHASLLALSFYINMC